MGNPKISIVILNWNGKADTIECLNSLKKITYPNYEVIIVDNGSIDGSVECFKGLYPEIEIVENEENLGFAEGNNVGIRKVMERGTDYVLLLNNDTVVDVEFIDELVKIAESDSKIGIIGPKIYYYDYNGRNDVISFAGEKLVMWKGGTVRYGEDEVDIRQYDAIQDVNKIEGSCMLIKKDMLQDIGLFETRYFVYWEETDLCIRAYKNGYRVVYAPKARIWHKIAKSSGGVKSPRYIYYMTRNRFLFMKLNATKSQFISFLLYFFGIQFWAINVSFIMKPKNKANYRCFLKGVADGIEILIND